MPEWLFAVDDVPTGLTVAHVVPRGASLTRRLNGGMTMRFQVPTLDDTATAFIPGRRRLRAYRDGVLRFHGYVSEPLSINPESVSIVAASPYEHSLRNRFLRRRTTFSNVDVGLMMKALVDAQNARAPTGMETDASFVQASTTSTCTFEAGKNVAEALSALAQSVAGLYFLEQPRHVAGYLSLLEVRHPASGVDASARAFFEYGAGTRANCEDFTVERTLPRNGVTARGATQGEYQLTARADDPESQGTYGLLEREVPFADVNREHVLQLHALEELESEPITAFAVKPLADNGSDALFVPSPWDDFDVGDLVTARADHGALQLDTTTARVVGFTLEIADDSKSEKLTDLILETT